MIRNERNDSVMTADARFINYERIVGCSPNSDYLGRRHNCMGVDEHSLPE